MNRNGRLVGGVLVGIALLWLLRILGALPFSDRSTNQLNQANAQIPPDRPLITNFDETRTSIANFNPETGTGTGTENFGTPGTGTDTGNGTVAQNPGTGTGTDSGASTRPAPPVVPGAW